MTASDLLSKLDGVRQTGDGRWISRCPAHDDRNPSLAIRELSDGRVLLHCFAGCEALTVLHAIGLKFPDLYPEPLRNPVCEGGQFLRESRPFGSADVLRCLMHEADVVLLAACDLARGEMPPRDRLVQAVRRIAAATEVCRL